MAQYNFKNEYTWILKKLRESKTFKEKHKWSREVGAGFIEEDIKNIEPDLGGLNFEFSWGKQTIPIGQLNLRETEETIKFMEKVKWESERPMGEK